jgi:hypothetical protein
MDPMMIRIVAGVMAAILLGVIVMRKKSHEAED